MNGNIIRRDFIDAAVDIILDLVERFPDKVGKKEDYEIDRNNCYIYYLKEDYLRKLCSTFVQGFLHYNKAYHASKDNIKFRTILSEYYFFGKFYGGLKEYDAALSVLNISLVIRQRHEKITYTHEIAIDVSASYLAIGYVYKEIDDYTIALNYFELG